MSEASYPETAKKVIKSKNRNVIGSVLTEDQKVLKQIDAEIEKIIKMNEKKTQKLLKVESRIEDLEHKKAQFLEGVCVSLPYNDNFHETCLRSITKAFSWRLIGGSVTFLSSLRFSSSLATASSIVASDFFSKAATMFIGERLMNKSRFGRSSGADNMTRSMAKVILWRIFSVCNTLAFATLLADDFKIACKIASFDSIYKTTLMFFFERIWAKIEWGKERGTFDMSP